VLRELLGFVVPASANGATYMAVLWLAATSVVQQTNGLLLSALYVACMNIKTLVLFVPQQANNVSVAYLSRYRANLPEHYRKALLSNLFLIVLGTAIGAAVVAGLAGEVLSLYGDAFVEGVDLLRVLMAAAVMESVGYGLAQ